MNFLLKKITAFYKRLGFFQGVALTLCVSSAISIAAVNIPGLIIFTPGTPISASQINSNFDKLAALIDNTRSQNYISAWDASINSPDIENIAHNIGDYYIVDTAGSHTFVNGESLSFGIGDWVIYNGISWEKIQATSGASQWISSGANLYNSTSKIGIGTSTPQTKLDVNGALKVGADATACSATIAGALRFSSPNVEYCNGTAWTSIATSGSAIASTQITDGTIVNSDVSATANIDATKLGTGVVDNVEFNYLNGVTSSIQTQLSGKQASDATLTALALHSTNGILVQTAADTFVGRSIAGTANRLSVTDGDGVLGNPTLNIDSGLLPSPLAGDAGKFLKSSAANTSTWTALSSSDVTTALSFTPINKAGDSISAGTFVYNGTSVLRTLDPIGVTDVVTKQYVDSFGQWTKSGSDIYRSSGKVGIGVSAPEEIVDIRGSSGTTLALRNMDTTATNQNTILKIDNYSGAFSGVPELQFHNSRGNLATRSPIAAGDNLAVISSFGRYDNTGNNAAGPRIEFKAQTAWDVSASTQQASMNFITVMNGSALPRMTILSSGMIGIGTTSPTSLLDVNGAINATGAVTSASDVRLKKNIESINGALEKLSSIDGVYYEWRKNEFPQIKFDDRRQMGVLAQEVEKVFPEAVNKNKNGLRSVAYSMLIAPIIEAIKELNFNKADKSEIEELKAQNAQMQMALCELGKKSFCR